jgi:hypothetical protein
MITDPSRMAIVLNPYKAVLRASVPPLGPVAAGAAGGP